MSDKCPKCGHNPATDHLKIKHEIAGLRRQLAKAEADNAALGKFVIDYTASLQDSAYDMINSTADRAAIADCLVEWLGGIVAQTRRFIAAQAAKEAT